MKNKVSVAVTVLVEDSPWIGMWVRYREGKMIIAPVEYFESGGAGGVDILHTSLDAISVGEVLEKRAADDFDIEALKRETTAEVAARLIKLLEEYRSGLATMLHSRKTTPDDVIVMLIEQVTVEYLRGETNA